MANHFDLTDLQLMVNIGDASSLTRGAEKSHLSLPAASNRVKNLEDHFGTRLFHRNSQGVTIFRTAENEHVVSVERLADQGGDEQDAGFEAEGDGASGPSDA